MENIIFFASPLTFDLDQTPLVHYEAPAAARLQAEMASFLSWLNGEDKTDLVVKAALAHLWFVTIHPFDDGNGRIARAIADMCLARSEDSSQRFYSMSAQIRIERKAYYDILETTQTGNLDITAWLEWFLSCLDKAFDGAENPRTAVTASGPEILSLSPFVSKAPHYAGCR